MTNLPAAFYIWLGVTMFFGILSTPLSIYIGFCFGTNQRRKAILGAALQTAIVVFDTWVYWQQMIILEVFVK